MKFYLRDINPDMVTAWKRYFDNIEDVEVSEGDIFEGPMADAIISPANSFGFMDGGIDLVYSDHFGWQLQERLQIELAAHHDGELPVGEAVIIPTNKADDIKFLISAPTMRVPMNVDKTVNAYLAFRASIRAIRDWNATHAEKPEFQIDSVTCPGLGTAVGKMSYDACAKQMFFAYCTCWLKYPQKISHLGDAFSLHHALI